MPLNDIDITFGMRELVHKSNPGHVRIQVFVGRGSGSRGNSGELTIRRAEWDEWRDQIRENCGSLAEYVDVLDPLDLEASDGSG
jgi:hypothetical protein